MPSAWIEQSQWDEVQRLLKNIQVYNGDIKYHAGGISITCFGEEGAGSIVKWAKITAITDANNYTADIYSDRNEGTASETSKAVRVWDIIDSLAVNDWIPVQSSRVTDKDYENLQQIGLL